MRVEISRITGLNLKQIEFSTNAYGKPFLVNCPEIHFNLSHAGNYIACATHSYPVGIDVEVIEGIDLMIAERFFAKDEIKYIFTDSKDSLEQRFFEIWTKKESYIKWDGTGLSKLLSSFSVFEHRNYEMIFYHKIFHNFEAICHTCSSSMKNPVVRFIDMDMLMQMAYVK